MSKIKTTDLSNDKKLTAEDMSNVKGGPVFLKLDDIKGESRAVGGRLGGGGGAGKVKF